MSLFPADDGRLRELILHFSHRCGDWETFTATLLERMLFQADFLHFRMHGFPITGQAYRRGIHSPAPRTMARIVRGMIQAGDLEIAEEPREDNLHVRSIPRAFRDPDLRIFDGQEIALVEMVIRFYRGNWREGSEGPDLLTLPWELAAPREEIPYSLALLGTLAGPGSRREAQVSHPLELEQAQGMRKLAHHSLILAS